MRARFYLLIAGCIIPGAWAESTPDYANWYQIEIIVFKQRGATNTDELWPLTQLSYPADVIAIGPTSEEEAEPGPLPKNNQSLDTGPVRATDPGAVTDEPTFLFESHSRQRLNRELLAEQAPPEGEQQESIDDAILASVIYAEFPRAFRQLNKEKLGLARIGRSLRLSSRFDLLTHRAWLQPLTKQPRPVLLQTGEQFGDEFEIDGTLSFSRTRFLHVKSDLWFTQFTTMSSQLVDSYIPIHSHRLQHTRRMRSNELHFIDHPFFGILIEITPFRYEPETAPL